MGFLNVFKPSGPTSHDVVVQIRRMISVKQVGHAGTLDPLASGVLVVAVGFATRVIEYLSNDKKKYRAIAILGHTTDTYDRLGEVLERSNIPQGMTVEDLTASALSFCGHISQRPPDFSAVKISGKRAYDLARRGEKVDLAPRQVTIYKLTVESARLPEFTLSIECSSGTYVRSLINDIGQALGCGATMLELTRLASGNFDIDASVQVSELSNSLDTNWTRHLIDIRDALPQVKTYDLSESDLIKVEHGRGIEVEAQDAEIMLAICPDNRPGAILRRVQGTNHWRPEKVFVRSAHMSTFS